MSVVPSGVIGRRAELARLRAALARAEAGTPAAVLITGDAGMGKTTLLAEASRQATDRAFAVAVGGCADLGAAVPFAPVQAAMHSLAGQHVGVEDLLRRYPAVASLLPGHDGGAPGADASKVFASTLGLLAEVAAERPVLLAFEDLHWADRSTIELVSYLLRNLGRERLAVVATSRWEPLASGAMPAVVLAELSRLRIVDRIELGGLGRTDLSSLLAQVVGRSLPLPVVDDLLERTDGNPFLAAELAAAQAFTPGALPDSLREVMAMRLRGLPDEVGEVLRVGSTLGPELSVPLLAELTGRPPAAVEESLRVAVGAGVLVSEPVSGAVHFRHALLQEAAYADLLPTERARIHTEVAAHLARGPRPAPPAVLAEHYERSGQAADQALVAWLEAARDAVGGAGVVDAVPAYEHAVTLWPTVDDPEAVTGCSQIDVLREATSAALGIGETDVGAAFAEQALAALDPADDPQTWADLAIQLSELRWEQGDMVAAEELLDRAEPHVDPETRPGARSRLLDRRSFHAVVSGDLDRAQALGREAVAAARASGQVELEVDAVNPLAIARAAAGAVDEAAALLADGHATARRHGVVRGLIRTTINQLVVLLGAGRITDAVAAGEAGLAAVAELTAIQPYHATTYAMLARAHFLAGDWDRCQEVLDEAPAVASRVYRGYLAVARADLELGRGDLPAAGRALAESQHDLTANPYWAVQRSVTEAAVAMARGRAREARDLVEAVIDLSEAWSDTTTLRLCSLGIDAVGAGAGSPADVDAYAARAERLVRRYGAGAPADADAWQAHVHAQRLAARGEPTAASWAAAAEGFAACGLAVRAAAARLEQAAATDDPEELRRLASEAEAVARSVGAVPLLERLAALGVAEPPAGVATGGEEGDEDRPKRTVYRFGDRELDVDCFELRRNGEVVALEPQVFDVLRHLVEHRDRVVTKEELLDEVWGDRFVSESALTSRIKTARRAVGDDGRRQEVIGTVHGRGYRFVAEVEVSTVAAGAARER